MMRLEICVDSVESAIAAQNGGAERLELCSALSEGGLTPSLGLIRAVREKVGVGVYAMIRPRGGDFYYSDEEFAVMLDDIAHAAQAGANGIVLGVLTPEGDVDVERTCRLVDAAGDMGVTFHRALDMTRNLEGALEDVISTGAHRVLTSGRSETAIAGAGQIATLVCAATGRIEVMACGGVRAENVRQLAQATGAREFHAALRTGVPSPVRKLNPDLKLGDAAQDEYMRYVVRTEDVKRLRAAMDEISSTQSVEISR